MFFIAVLPPYFGYTGFDVNISIAKYESVGIYLEFHLPWNLIGRYALIHLKAKTGSNKYVPFSLPLYLFFTIVNYV
jgi:ACR3 family arsenite transporter